MLLLAMNEGRRKKGAYTGTKILGKDGHVAQFRKGNGLNGEMGSVLMNGENPFFLHVIPQKINQNYTLTQYLQSEGVRNNIIDLSRKAAGIGILSNK